MASSPQARDPLLPTRFTSLDYAPSETRSLLRVRLTARLGDRSWQRQLRPEHGTIVRDEDLLEALQAIEFHHAAADGPAQALYAAGQTAGIPEPSWNERVAQGWMRSVWGRFAMHYDLYAAATRGPSDALSHWARERHHVELRLRPGAALTQPASQLASDIVSGDGRLSAWSSPDTRWVAARLWDRSWRTAASPEAALRRWLDQWSALGGPNLIPGEVWDAEDARAFTQASFAVLQGDVGLPGWDAARALYARQSAIVRKMSPAVFSDPLEVLPDTLVGRAEWLGGRLQEGAINHGMEAAADVLGLVRLLWNDVAAEDHAPAPHPTAVRLLNLAGQRPELLAGMLHQLEAVPKILADVLLHPPAAALACLLIARRRSVGFAFDRARVERDFATDQAAAFADAVAVMGWRLARGETPVAEAAALLVWLHDQAPSGFIDDGAGREPLRATLRDELFSLPPSTLASLVESLVRSLETSPKADGVLPAALELAEASPITDPVLAGVMAEAYLGLIVAEPPRRLNAARIGRSGAASLMSLPLDAVTRARLLEGPAVDGLNDADDGETYILERRLGAALRTHTRVLCRAVVELANPPTDLVEALIAAVRAGAKRDRHRRRIPAFAPHFEASDFDAHRDRPLALDLAAALRTLEEPGRGLLLKAILTTDEPMMLARLHAAAPPAQRSAIAARADALDPSEAAEVFSLTEMQARVDALLDAGLLTAAVAHSEAEREAQTLGRPDRRALVHLGTDLRLLLARGDWDAILAHPEPSGLPVQERDDARDTLQFYRGLALLLRPAARDAEAAEAIFEDLHTRKPHIASYGQNLVAARVTRLMGDDIFGTLSGPSVVEAGRLLTAIARAQRDTSAEVPGRDTLFSNAALLQLAIGDPEEAFVSLANLSDSHTDPHVLGQRAVTLSRLGRQGEAMAALETAEEIGVATPYLQAVRAHLIAGVKVDAAVGVAQRIERVASVRSALRDLASMDPHEQAAVLGPPDAELHTYLTREVRAAASSLVRLVPVLKVVTVADREDDLNTLLREILLSRLVVPKWAVADQSLGGFTGSGGAGERDAVVQTDTIELSCVEALICEKPVQREGEQQNIREHFQKLFGYSGSRILYLVIYAFGVDLTALEAFLLQMAASDAPEGYTLIGRSEFASGDSRPRTFEAQYAVDGDTVRVVFLNLDLGQARARAAAKTARAQPTPAKPRSKT